ncbi:acyl-CoA dehydrogenase family protein [Streptomyces nogalater]
MGQAARIIAGVRQSGATLGAVSVGIAEAAWELALTHARRRGLDRAQAVRHRLADLAAQVESARALVERAGRRESSDPGTTTLLSKLHASRTGEQVCLEAQRLLGSAAICATTPEPAGPGRPRRRSDGPHQRPDPRAGEHAMEHLTSYDLLVTNARLVTPEGVRTGALAVAGGRIARILSADAPLPAATRTLDAAGRYVLPGVIDSHVHFRTPGLTHKETWHHGSRAAAAASHHRHRHAQHRTAAAQPRTGLRQGRDDLRAVPGRLPVPLRGARGHRRRAARPHSARRHLRQGVHDRTPHRSVGDP